MFRMALIASFFFCSGSYGQTLTQKNLYKEFKKADFAKSLLQVKGEELSCRYVSMLDGTYHDSQYSILIDQRGIQARSSKGAESFSLSGPARLMSDRVYSEKVESSFIGWMLGHEPAVFVYEYKVLGNDLFIAKSSKGKSSRTLFKVGEGKPLLSLYKCDIAKARNLASLKTNDDGRGAKLIDGLEVSSPLEGNKTKPN